MNSSGKRKLGGRRGKRGRRSVRIKTENAAVGRVSEPSIAYWDFDAIGGDGSNEEVYEIGISPPDIGEVSKSLKRKPH